MKKAFCLTNVPRVSSVIIPPTTRATRLSKPVRFRPDSSSESIPGRKILNGPCVIEIQGKKGASTKFILPLGASSSASLQDYMANAADHFADISLPLGGSMKKLDDQHLLMIVPKIKIMDLWLQPSSRVKVTILPNRLEVTSTTADCVMDGSHQVKELGLHERYNVDVRIILTWNEGSSPALMETDGRIMVEVDVPKPFSMLPKKALTAAGNVAMTATLGVIMNAFLDKLAGNFTTWAKMQKAAQEKN